MTVIVLRQYEQAGRRRRYADHVYVSISFMKMDRVGCFALCRTGTTCAPDPSSAR